MVVVGLYVFLARLLPATLWPNSFGIGESGMAQLKLTSSQLVHNLGPLFAEILVMCPRQRILSQKCYGKRHIIITG